MTFTARGGAAEIRVRIDGNSMRPFFTDGSSAYVALCRRDNIRVGDIAVFKDGPGFICHRVLRIVRQDDKMFFRTKGDAAFYPDIPTGEDLILGKVVAYGSGNTRIFIDNDYFRILGLFTAFTFPFVHRCLFLMRKFLNINGT